MQETITMELAEKTRAYKEYIEEHIVNVQKSFIRYFIPLLSMNNLSSKIADETLKNAIAKAKENIRTHDASKYSEEEFESYRYRFFPTDAEKNDPNYAERCKNLFKIAWKHHYRNNKHHANYWTDDNLQPIADMPIEYIIEMVSDWLGMSITKRTPTMEWYENDAQKEKSYMTPNTIAIVNELLYNILPKVGKIL